MSLPPAQSQADAPPSHPQELAFPVSSGEAVPAEQPTAPHATHRRSASMPAHPPVLLAPGLAHLPTSMSGALSVPASPTTARGERQREAPHEHVQVVHHHHHYYDPSAVHVKAVEGEVLRAPRSSLAWQSGRGRSLLVTLLCVGCHALFFYAQLTGTALDCPGSGGTPCVQHFEAAGVAQGLISFHMDYEAYGALAESIGIAEKLMCATDCPNPTIGVPDETEAWSTPHFAPKAVTPVPVDINNISGFACAALRCDTCRSVFGLQTWQSCALDFEYTLLHMSYLYSVDELWSAKGPQAEDGADTYPGRAAAALIFIFSFVWPHVKLLLLQLAFYVRVTEPCRRNVNFWLAFGGKWSLTDVIVMCVIIALFNIPLSMPLQQLWGEFEDTVGGQCEQYCLGSPIAPRLNCTLLCDHLEQIVSAHVLSPQELSAGQVTIDLRMRGLDAMYAFCVAVVLSLTVGILIEHLAERVKSQQAKVAASSAKEAGAGGGTAVGVARSAAAAQTLWRLGGLEEAALTPDAAAASPAAALCEGSAALSRAEADAEPLSPSVLSPSVTPLDARQLATDVSGVILLAAEGSERSCSRPSCEGAGGEAGPAGCDGSVPMLARWRRGGGGGGGGGWRAWLRGVPGEREWFLGVELCGRRGAVHVAYAALVLLQLCVTVGAFATPIFIRQCRGALAQGLRAHGIDFDGSYNMVQMATLAAEGGGMNYLMAGTFWIFVILGPVSRSLSLLALLVLPLSRPRLHKIHQLSRHVSAYYAYEVLLLAVPLINVAFGPMTSSLLKAGNFPLCGELQKLYPQEDTCFQINVVPGTGYKFTIAVVVVFFFCGFDGSPTHKYVHRRLFPGDNPPPTCPVRRRKTAPEPPRGAVPQPHRDYEAWRSHDLGEFQDI